MKYTLLVITSFLVCLSLVVADISGKPSKTAPDPQFAFILEMVVNDPEFKILDDMAQYKVLAHIYTMIVNRLSRRTIQDRVSVTSKRKSSSNWDDRSFFWRKYLK